MKPISRVLALAIAALLPAGSVYAQCVDIPLAPATVSNATQGTPFSATFKPGGGPPGTWSSAALPQGMGLSQAGSLNGTPTTAGNFPLRLIFTGNDGCVAGLFLPLTVDPTTGPVPRISIERADNAEPTPVPLAGSMSITDSDAGATTFTATIGVSEGTVTAAAGTNTVTVTDSGTALVTLSGTLPEINALLAGSNGATVAFASGGARFDEVLLTLSANDGSLSGSASAIMSGATVRAPRVWVIAPSSTRQLAVSTRDALGNTIDGSPYSFASSNTTHVNVDSAGLLSSGTTLNFAELTVGSGSRRPAKPWIAVNNITSVTVGSNVPSSIASSDGFSAFGSNVFLPSTSYYGDVFTIALSANQSVVFKADSGDDLDTYMILADADGNVLAINDDDDTGTLGVGSRINFTAPAAGTYVIEQSTFNGLDTGSYTFIVENGLPPRPGSTTTATPLREHRRSK